MDFNRLVQTLIQLEDGFRLEAGRAVNQYMTVRNWLMGFYIVEFEQNGEDRARYGAGLIRSLAKAAGRSGLSFRNLNLFRKFYLIYPHVHEKVTDFLKSKSIGQTSAQLLSTDYQALTIVQTSAQSFETDAELLLSRLSFSHLVLLMQIEEPLRRAFYELESIRGGWSVRELKRQMDSLLYERTGLSRDKAAMLHHVHQEAAPLKPEDFIRNPFVFEFLGLPMGETVAEGELEKALLDHLQMFLLELGRGFCFEARQKRLLIGSEWYKVDLVFYHRLLKCHVLIDLKSGPFRLEYAGQMNGYVNFYREHEQQPDDNPPIGLLLCTDREETVVRYAIGGLDERIFVSQYRLHLPAEQDLKAFLSREQEHLASQQMRRTRTGKPKDK
jgi:predicted nuclease of restriction endonuclease-like (RecB) superfamily